MKIASRKARHESAQRTHLKMDHELADNTAMQFYFQRLAHSYPSLLESWLFGSRADATHKADSDWDLLVFADRHDFEKMKSDNSLQVGMVDLLVVFDGDHFEQPWTEPGQPVPKCGSLTQWQWKKETDNEASYWCSRRRCHRRAFCLWTRAQ